MATGWATGVGVVGVTVGSVEMTGGSGGGASASEWVGIGVGWGGTAAAGGSCGGVESALRGSGMVRKGAAVRSYAIL